MITSQRVWRARLPILLATLAVLASARWLQGQERVTDNRTPRTWETTPANRDSLGSLQERVQAVSRRVMPAVVAVEEAEAASPSGTEKPRVSRHYASGVIITEDGLILSQFHVSHRLNHDPVTSRQPGERTMVILSDGRKIEAELLGADMTFDLSLLRLLEPGPYPHVPLDPAASVDLGDWVLKLGHPQSLGYRRDRPPVVRLGRVLFQNRDIFVTDCFITGGDSGGPFFDIEGRLVGIIDGVTVPAKLEGTLSNHRQRAARSGPFSGRTNRFIQQRLDEMLRGEMIPDDQRARDKFDEKSFLRAGDDDILPREQWTQGKATAKAFRDVVRDSRPSVVSILDEADHDVAQGTIVGPSGWIVTMASTLPAGPNCRLSDGRVVAAQVVGMDPAFDLALLKVPVTGLRAVHWAEKPPPVAGTILAATGISEVPLGIGVVSVPRRNLLGPFPTRVARPTIPAARLGLRGKPTAEGFVAGDIWGTAAEAGLRRKDVILAIADTKIRDDRDIAKCAIGLREGERVPVILMRDGQRQELTLELDGMPLTDSRPYAADFPTLFEHDMPLLPVQCGGPAVDLDGEAVGITMYRCQYGCVAIPADCIERLLPELKSGGLADKWIKPPAATPDHRKPSGLDEKSQ